MRQIGGCRDGEGHRLCPRPYRQFRAGGALADKGYVADHLCADEFWFQVGEGTDIVVDYFHGTDKIGVGASIVGINLYNYNGSALLEFVATGATSTYALLNGVAPTAIDGTDFLWA